MPLRLLPLLAMIPMPPRRERGQVLVLFVLAFVGILALVGLVYSIGFVFEARRSDQMAADAAALGGTWALVAQLQSQSFLDSTVSTSVTQYATTNGVASSGVSAKYVDSTGTDISGGSVGGGGTFPTTARGVHATLSGTVSTLLPNFVGLSSITVSTQSIAQVVTADGPSSATPVIPVGVSVADFTPAFSAGTTFDLFGGGLHLPSGATSPILDYGATGSSAFASGASPTTYGSQAQNVQYWSDGEHGNGTLLAGATVTLAGGSLTGNVTTGLRDNITRQGLTDSSSTAYALILLPVWDTSSSTPSPGTVHVAGFALMKLTSVSSGSARGIFVPYVQDGLTVDTSPNPDLGARLVRLVK